MEINGSSVAPVFGQDGYNEFKDKLKDYKVSTRVLMRKVGMKIRFVQRNPADTEPVVEILNSEGACLIRAGLVHPKNKGPILLHIQTCGKMDSEHSRHTAWGREIKSHLDVYRCLLDEMNILSEKRCVIKALLE